MALVLADRVKVRARTTGTGTFTLESTAEGYQGFEAVGNGNETYYGIVDAHGNWEIGRGTYTASGTTLSRDTIISSSNNDALVNFPAGGKNVFGTFPSSIALALISGGGLDLSAVGQNILPAIDSDGATGYTLGSAAFKWKELFVSNGSIYIGDVKLSNVGGKLSVVKVINPGEDDEEEDSEDSEADSEIKSVNKLVNDEHEFKLESDGTLTLDGDPFTGGSGSGVDGLTGNTDFTPTQEGNTRYELEIAGDITLVTYETGDGANDLGPGFSLGFEAGSNVGSGVVAIGNIDTGYKSKRGGVYIGYQAGWNDAEQLQGEFAIAIGARAARNIAEDNSITLNATGNNLDPTADGLYIKPIREMVENTAKALYYDTDTGEVSYADPTGSGSNSYTPDDTDNWEDPEVNTIQAALDELAARITALQNFEIDGGNAYTPAAGELLIDGNGA